MRVPVNLNIMSKGDMVSLRGNIKYWADHFNWEWEFSGETFEVSQCSADRCCLKTPGLHDGEIYIFYRHIEGKIFKADFFGKKRYFLGKTWVRFKSWLRPRLVMGFSFRLPKKYVFGVSGLWPIRKFKDGLTVFEFDINLDLFKDDHNPKFGMMLVLFNLKLFELEVYKASR